MFHVFQKKGLLFLIFQIICLCWFFTPVYAGGTDTTLTISYNSYSPEPSYQVTGVLNTISGEPLGNKRVFLEISSGDPLDNDSFDFVAMDDTDRTGAYSFYRPSNIGENYVRVVFHGNNRYNNAISEPVMVVKGPLTPEGEPAGETGSVMVKSSPGNALVCIDGDESGYTPVVIPSLSVGAHDLVLSKEGFQNESMEVFIAPDQMATLSLSLNPSWVGLTKSGVSATLAVNENSNMSLKDPVFVLEQNNLNLGIYSNASSDITPDITTIYSGSPFNNGGYSLSVIITDKKKTNNSGF